MRNLRTIVTSTALVVAFILPVMAETSSIKSPSDLTHGSIAVNSQIGKSVHDDVGQGRRAGTKFVAVPLNNELLDGGRASLLDAPRQPLSGMPPYQYNWLAGGGG